MPRGHHILCPADSTPPESSSAPDNFNAKYWAWLDEHPDAYARAIGNNRHCTDCGDPTVQHMGGDQYLCSHCYKAWTTPLPERPDIDIDVRKIPPGHVVDVLDPWRRRVVVMRALVISRPPVESKVGRWVRDEDRRFYCLPPETFARIVPRDQL